MTELRPQDIRRVIDTLPKDIVALMRDYNLILAGGYVRDVLAGRAPHDIDLFGEQENLRNAAETYQGPFLRDVVETPFAITVRNPGALPVQFIIGFPAESPAALINRFNFTVSQAAITPVNWYAWESACATDFYADLAARRLVYTNHQTDAGAAKSLHKLSLFLKEGWTIEPESLYWMVARAAWPLRKAQSIDAFYGGLTKLMRGEYDGFDFGEDGENALPYAGSVEAETHLIPFDGDEELFPLSPPMPIPWFERPTLNGLVLQEYDPTERSRY